MITAILIFVLILVCMILGLCFKITGGILKLVIKLAICLPCAIVFAALGVVFCCTILLIPLGIGCFKIAGGFLCPFKECLI